MLKYAALAATLIGGVRADTIVDLQSNNYGIDKIRYKMSGPPGASYKKYYKVQAHVEFEGTPGDYGFQLEYCINQADEGGSCNTVEPKNPANYYYGPNNPAVDNPMVFSIAIGNDMEDTADVTVGNGCLANVPPGCTPPSCDTTGCTKEELQAAYRKVTESSTECYGETGSHVDPVRADCDTSHCDAAELDTAHVAACA